MIQTLVSVPPALDSWIHASPGPHADPFHALADFLASDPAGTKLGSGGGTVSLLHRAWLSAPKARRPSLHSWISGAQRLVLHSGGESRRLPAYAGIGKALLPVAPAAGQDASRFDQVLADFQIATYRQVVREAGPDCAMMVASGDVWLDLDPLAIPTVHTDIAGIGMRVTPELAQHFGVFFVPKASARQGGTGAKEQPIAFFLQKPSPREIYRHSARYDFYVDTGLWMFSVAAVEFLFRRCGWNETRQAFTTENGQPSFLDLYTEVGSSLGAETAPPKALERFGWSRLTTSVIPLDDAQFFHVGSSRQLLESFEQLSTANVARAKTFSFATPARQVAVASNLAVWVDAAGSGKWQLEGLNVVTGSAPGAAPLRLAQEQCVDIAPLGRSAYVVRPYLLDDRMRGAVGAGGMICGHDAARWLERRGFPRLTGDVFELPIYPLLPGSEINQSLLDWFFTAQPSKDISDRVLQATRVSAAEIPAQLNYTRYFAERAEGHTRVLLEQFEACDSAGDVRVFDQDFSAIAAHARQHRDLREWLLRRGPRLVPRLPRPEHQSRVLMLLAALTRGAESDRFAQRAHAHLQRGVLTSDQLGKSQPRLALKEDQIVWGRSPVRLDLAGGWTDTPPYCLDRGGSVVNVAVLLNGQPPIQVFVRPLSEPVISLKSIDLGSTEVISTYAGLASFRNPTSGFSLPKAALAMAGFHPDFSGAKPAATLKARLTRFGGGLEISLLSAVPKGSGLGTSSILAATILGALNRACGLGWDEVSLYNRVLAVEQLLTTGGGWQDQAGALFRGLKLIETAAGPAQRPTVRYLPQHIFDPSHANRTLLLYYTGITRLAKGILKEIVHDMFLGRFETLQTLGLVRANAHALFQAVQQSDPAAVHRCIARSWDLNKRLDRGTTTPEIESILRQCGPDLAAAKLLGAGGGGYMLLCAVSPESGDRIRSQLEQRPPNSRARFIDFEIADSGLEVTVS